MQVGDTVHFPVGIVYDADGTFTSASWRPFTCVGFEPYVRKSQSSGNARAMSLAVIEGQCCHDDCHNTVTTKIPPYFPFAVHIDKNGRGIASGAIAPFCREHQASPERFAKFETTGKVGRPTADKTPLRAWIRSLAKSRIGMAEIQRRVAEAPEHIRVLAGYEAISSKEKYIMRLVADMVQDKWLVLEGKSSTAAYVMTPVNGWAETIAYCRYGSLFAVPWERIRDADEEGALDIVEMAPVIDTWIMRAEQLNMRRLVFGVPELPLWEFDDYVAVKSQQNTFDKMIQAYGPIPTGE